VSVAKGTNVCANEPYLCAHRPSGFLRANDPCFVYIGALSLRAGEQHYCAVHCHVSLDTAEHLQAMGWLRLEVSLK